MANRKRRNEAAPILSAGSLVHTGEVAEFWGVSRTTVRNMVGSSFPHRGRWKADANGEVGWFVFEWRDVVAWGAYTGGTQRRGEPYVLKRDVEHTPEGYCAWKASKEAEGYDAVLISGGWLYQRTPFDEADVPGCTPTCYSCGSGVREEGGQLRCQSCRLQQPRTATVVSSR